MSSAHRRRILLASGALLASPVRQLAAQAPNNPQRIVVVSPAGGIIGRSYFDRIRDELKTLGNIEGRDVIFEARWADNSAERLSALVSEAVAMNPAVIVTHSSVGIAAFKRATSTIPIVFHSAFNPVEQGFVASMARPGGNITGVILYSTLIGKVVEVCREALPTARRLALLTDEIDRASKISLESFNTAAKALKFDPIVVSVSHAKDLDGAFKEIAERKAEAILVAELNFNVAHLDQLISRALSAKLPALSAAPGFAVRGGLVSYATDYRENIQRAAVLVDKILRGAKPGDLAVEQPTRFQLIVNLKTAKAIGVTLSPTTMLRATQAIE